MRRISFPLALACTLVAAGSGVAQAPWLGVDHAPRLAAEVMKPSFAHGSELHPASSTFYLSGRIPVGQNLAVVAELPVAVGGFRYDSGNDLLAGNPYLGLETSPGDGVLWAEFGGRLPLVGSDPSSAVLVGLYSDIDRYSAFAPSTVSLSGALNLGKRAQSGAGVRVRFGPEVWVPTSNTDTRQAEVLGNYGAQLYYVSGPLELSTQGSGFVILTGRDRGDFGQRSVHQLGFGASYLLGGVRPGLVLRLPLDHDLQDMLNYVVGLTLQVPLR